MNYPTPEEVEQASQEQLGRWLRFLDSPGMSAVRLNCNSKDVDDTLQAESKIMHRVRERFIGWTPELSRRIGWDDTEAQ